MRIGIDISQSAYEKTGVGRFTAGLAESIVDLDNDNNWVFLFSSLRGRMPMHLQEKINSSKKLLKKLPLSPSILSFLWNDLHLLPVENFIGKLDWYISSDWTEPPAKCHKATIVHDLVFKRYPETVHQSILSVQEKRLALVKKETSLIFADSESTKKDLENYYDIPSEKVIVNYPGVTIPRVTPEQTDGVKSKYKLDKPYLLAVGKQEPRKNYDRLVEAFQSLKNDGHELVIVGSSGWKDVPKSTSVKVLSFVTDEELYALYAGSLAFIFPSLYEGFGYPLIEAMLLGVPTACSNTSSLKEISQGSSLLFDPMEIADIAGALKKMIEDTELRKQLVQKGKKSAAAFTWERYYTNMIGALQKF